MSVSINSTLDAMTPVYNEVGFDVSSTNTAQTNFKYICDVYWSGATAPIRKKQPAEPSNGYCRFDMSGILRSYVTSNPTLTAQHGFAHCSDSYINYTMQFGEEYGPSSGTTVYANLTTSSGTVWNACYTYDEIVAGPVPTYLSPGSSRKFLTSHPGSTTVRHKVTTSDPYALYFLNGETAAYNCQIKTYNSSNALIDTIVFGTTYTTNEKVLSVGVGPADLLLLDISDTRFSGTLPAIGASVNYYTVQLVDSGGTAQSALTYFQIVEDCSKYDVYRLQFLNKTGGFDQFSFYGAPKKTTEIQRSSFKKIQGEWSGTLFAHGYQHRSKTNYQTIIQDTIRLRSDWVHESELSWLEELVTSPEVYYYDTDLSNWLTCNVSDSGFEYKKRASDVLFNLEISIQPTYNRYRQQV